eukprot:31161-Pelagococcus_subviridis.AAC.7
MIRVTVPTASSSSSASMIRVTVPTASSNDGRARASCAQHASINGRTASVTTNGPPPRGGNSGRRASTPTHSAICNARASDQTLCSSKGTAKGPVSQSRSTIEFETTSVINTKKARRRRG